MAVEGMHPSSAQAGGPTPAFHQFRGQSEAERPFVPILGGPKLFVLMLYASVIVVASLQYFVGEDFWPGAWDIYNSYVFVITGVFVFLGMILLFTGKRLPAEETKLPVAKTYLGGLGLALMLIDGVALIVFGKSIGGWAVLASVLLVTGFILMVFASEVIPTYDANRLALFGAGLIIMILVPVHEAFGVWQSNPGDYPFTLLNLALLTIGMTMAVFGVQSLKTRDGFIGAWLMGAMAIFLLAFHEQIGIEIVASGNYSIYDRTLALIGISFSFLPLALYFWRERVYLYLWTKLKWANRLMETGDYEGSLKHTDAALKQCMRVGIEDRFALPWSLKADVLYRMKEYPKARVHYETALQIDPKDGVSWSNVGNMNAFEGKQEAALKAYDEALKADPKNPTVWNNKGVVYQSMGMYQEAMICFDKALGYDPDFFDAHINMAKLESRLGHSNDSLRHYQRAFDLKPDSAVARDGVAKEFYRGMCLDQINGWESLGLDTAPLRQILEQDPAHFLFRTKEFLRSIVDKKAHIQTTPSKEHIDMDAAFKTILELVEPPGATIEELKEYTGLKERDLVLPIAILSETDKIYFETLDDRQVYVQKGKPPERPRPLVRVARPSRPVMPLPARDSIPPPSVYDIARAKRQASPPPPPEKPQEARRVLPPPPEPEPEPITQPMPQPKREVKPPPPPAPKPEPRVEAPPPPPPPPPEPKPEPKAEVAPVVRPAPPVRAPEPAPPPSPVAAKAEIPKPVRIPIEDLPLVTITCPGCGLTLNGDERKCPRCDLPLESAMLDCPICGEEFEFSSQSCPKCGAVFRRPAEQTLLKPEAPPKPPPKPTVVAPEPEVKPALPKAGPSQRESEEKRVPEKKPEPKKEPPSKKEKEKRVEPAKHLKESKEKKPVKPERRPEEELEEEIESEEGPHGLIERNVVTVEPTASMLVFTKVKPRAKPAARPVEKPKRTEKRTGKPKKKTKK